MDLVLKRVLAVTTIGTLVDGHLLAASILVASREALSAITDYSAVKNPTITTTQTTPPATNDEQTN